MSIEHPNRLRDFQISKSSNNFNEISDVSEPCAQGQQRQGHHNRHHVFSKETLRPRNINDFKQNMKPFYIDCGHFAMIGWSRNKAGSQVFPKCVFFCKNNYLTLPGLHILAKCTETGSRETDSAETR